MGLNAKNQKEASHVACCHRSRFTKITNLHPRRKREYHQGAKLSDQRAQEDIRALAQAEPGDRRDGLGVLYRGRAGASGWSRGEGCTVDLGTQPRRWRASRYKTDRRDAQKISEASVLIDLPSVHIPRTESRRRKTLTRMRGTLVEVRTKLINSVRGWLRTEICRIRSGGAESFSRRVRERFTKDGHVLPSFVERLLGSIEDLSVKIAEADEELELEAREDPTCQLLMSVPGIGPVTAMRYVATIDVIERFKGASAVTSYVGLTPGDARAHPTEPHCDHQSRRWKTALGPGTGGVDDAPGAAQRPDGAMVCRGGKAARQAGRRGGAGAQIVWSALCAVARWYLLQPHTWSSSSGVVATGGSFAPYNARDGIGSISCPEAVTTGRPMRLDLVASIVARRRTSTYAAQTAHARLRQLDRIRQLDRSSRSPRIQRLRTGVLDFCALDRWPLHA